MNNLSVLIAKAQGFQNGVISTKAQLLNQLEDLKSQLELAPEIRKVFAVVSDKLSTSRGGVYSELLTAIVNEVFDSVDQNVELVATLAKNNRPEVHIKTIKGDRVEDPITDRGGSITNLLSVGIRLIALANTCNRRFIMLDEPDCWLRGDKAERFAYIIGKLCHECGIQCLYISHQEHENLSQYGTLHNLLNKNGGTSITSHFNEVGNKETSYRFNGEIAGSNYIRYVRLANIAGHKNLNIDLDAGLNVISGDNDLGKSRVIIAINSLITASSLQNLISEGADTGSVAIGIEDGMELIYSFSNVTSDKGLYTLKSNSGDVIKNTSIKKQFDVPDWVQTLLCMPLVNGVNLHYGAQKESEFLLHPSYSAQKRAEMINFGDAYYDFIMLVSRFEKDQKNISSNIKVIDSQLDSVNRQLMKMRWIDDAEELASGFSSLATEQLINDQEMISCYLSLSSKRSGPVEHVASLFDQFKIDIHSESDVLLLEDYVEQLNKCKSLVGINELSQCMPELFSSLMSFDGIQEKFFSDASLITQYLTVNPQTIPPVLVRFAREDIIPASDTGTDLDSLQTQIECYLRAMKENSNSFEIHKMEMNQLTSEVNQLDHDIHEQLKNGATCPLCSSSKAMRTV